MRETCFCGRSGEVEDRVPVLDNHGRQALRCPNEGCGHLDDLSWLSEEASLLVWDEARRRGEDSAQRVA